MSRGNLLTIGQLADRTRLSVRMIRAWSDLGIVPPAGRSPAGYRLYDEAAPARLELVRTLRGLGLGLAPIARILDGKTSLADVARTHLAALEVEIRTLQARRAVLRWAARGVLTPEEMSRMHRLAQLTAEQRQQLIEEFVDQAFAGTDPAARGAGIAAGMRQAGTALPEHPTAEQVDAWVELAELTQDPGFRARVRGMAVTGGTSSSPPVAHELVLEHAGAAAAAGLAPDSAEGQAVLTRVVPPGTPATKRAELAARLRTFTDARVERYWQLLGILAGWPPQPPTVPAYEWLIAALRGPYKIF